MSEATLSTAAFGNAPSTWPLPAAVTPAQLWLRAVAAGGQGRYSSARTDLVALSRTVQTGRLASLAYSTRGSFLRQLGWHALARGFDGCALVVANADPEATADALIGLAADALGLRRLAAGTVLLARADDALAQSAVSVSPRVAVRRLWVAAELAMAGGNGAAAVRHAERAAESAAAMLPASTRHGVKSAMVLAAALCCAGATGQARAVGDAALSAADDAGLDPLCWALTHLLAGIGSATRTPAALNDARNACADRVRRGGGVWRDG